MKFHKCLWTKGIGETSKSHNEKLQQAHEHMLVNQKMVSEIMSKGKFLHLSDAYPMFFSHFTGAGASG